MRLLTAAFLSLTFAVGGMAADNAPTDAAKADGWKLLFDGSSTTGWVNRDKDELKNWKAIDGAFVRDGGGR